MPLRTFQTVSLDSSSIDIFAKSSADKFHADPSIFEKHTLELITDAVYASRLENDFDALDAEFDGAKSASKRGQEKFDAMQTLISNSISAAKSQYENKVRNPGVPTVMTWVIVSNHQSTSSYFVSLKCHI